MQISSSSSIVQAVQRTSVIKAAIRSVIAIIQGIPDMYNVCISIIS